MDVLDAAGQAPDADLLRAPAPLDGHRGGRQLAGGGLFLGVDLLELVDGIEDAGQLGDTRLPAAPELAETLLGRGPTLGART